MEAKVKLGCLQNTERVRGAFHVGGSNFQEWKETYEYTRFKLPLPTEGAEETTMPCPICTQMLTIKRSSLAQIHTLLQWALIAWALVSFVVAGLLYSATLKSPSSTLTMIAVGFAVVGGLALVATLFCEHFPPSLIKSGLVTISHDEIRSQPQTSGHAGKRGHKLLEVHIS